MQRRRYDMHIALLNDFHIKTSMDFPKVLHIISEKEAALHGLIKKILKSADPEFGEKLSVSALDQTIITSEQFNSAIGDLEDSAGFLSRVGLRQWVRSGVPPSVLSTALLAHIRKSNLLRGFSIDLKKLFFPELQKSRSAYSTKVSIACGTQSFDPELSLTIEASKGDKALLNRISAIGVLLPHEMESFAALSLKIRSGVTNEMVEDYFKNLLLKLQLLPHVLPPRYRDELAKVSMVYNFKSKIRDGRAYVYLLFDFFVLLSQTSRRDLKELETFLTILASEATDGKAEFSLGFKTGLEGMLNDPRKDILVHLLEAFKLSFSASTSGSLKSMIVELMQNMHRDHPLSYLILLPIIQNVHLSFANFRELPDELMRKVLEQLKPKGAQTMAGIWRVIAMKIYRKRNMYSVLKVPLIVPLRNHQRPVRPLRYRAVGVLQGHLCAGEAGGQGPGAAAGPQLVQTHPRGHGG